jgi:hypothetical protein
MQTHPLVPFPRLPLHTSPLVRPTLRFDRLPLDRPQVIEKLAQHGVKLILLRNSGERAHRDPRLTRAGVRPWPPGARSQSIRPRLRFRPGLVSLNSVCRSIVLSRNLRIFGRTRKQSLEGRARGAARRTQPLRRKKPSSA